jgi:hypothetical protein
MHHAGGVEEGVDLIDQLLHVEDNLDRLAEIAGVGASLRCTGDAGGLLQALVLSLICSLSVAFRMSGSMATTHALWRAEVQWKPSNLMAD